MEKQNDFLAAQLNAPDNFTLMDFYTYGLTPDNTGLKDKDYYKDIKQVQEAFTNSSGDFDDVAFDQFYESARRSYNDWAKTDFLETLVKNISRAPENFQQTENRNIRDTSTKLFQANDPWRHQRGFGNLYEIGKEGYDIREVAQENYVRDADGNILDWTPNDKGGLIKGLFRNPMALAKDDEGNYLLDDEGNPFYRELKDGESIRGKEILHYTDTLTKEDSWLNKIDFFDNDSLDKSVGGTITKTLVSLAPYLIPSIGPTFGAIGAVYNLAKSFPFVAKMINGIITDDTDNTEFGQTMNNWEAFFSKFDTSKSRYSMDHQWSMENIGDMVVSSAKQLFQQRTFTRIPEILKLDAAQANPELFKTLSLGYMALTSSVDSLDVFKNGGMSDRSAGVASLAYTAALFGLMNQDYFKDWIFQNKWVNARPEITNSLRENSKAAASIMEQSIKNATAKNPKLLTIGPETSTKEAQSLFKTVWNATKQAWNNKSIDPFKGLDITLPGSVNAGNVYIHRALNEGIEETMEEGLLDAIKLTSLALESLGFDISDDVKSDLDFGLTWNDISQRYTTAFVGGAIGGAVFQGVEDWHSKLLNHDLSTITGRGLNGELIKNIRLYGESAVLKELDRLHNNGVLGNKNLAMRGEWTKDPADESKQIWTWNESGDSTNQNDFVYNVMKNRIQTLANIMQDENLLMSDNEILKQIQSDIKSKAEAEVLSEEAYMKRHGILPFDEFAQKTGFADIVLTDVGNKILDIVQTEEAIEARKIDLTRNLPDNRSSEKESIISKDSVIKQLEKQKKDLKQQLDDIEHGKAASYYIRYANFAAHSHLVSSLMTAEGNTTLDKEAFAYWKYRTTYSEAGEKLKEIIDKDYEEYVKLKGIAALEAANTLYQHAVDLAKPLIQKQQIEYGPSRINPTTVGSYLEDPDSMDTSILLNRDGWTDMKALFDWANSEDVDESKLQDIIKNVTNSFHLFVDDAFRKGAGNPPEQIYSDLLTHIHQFYTGINQEKQLAYGADDWVKYALKRIAQDVLAKQGDVVKKVRKLAKEQQILKLSDEVAKADNFNNIEYANIFADVEDPYVKELVSDLITIPYSEEETDENGDPTRQSEIKQELQEYVEQNKQNFLDRNNIFRERGSDLDTAKQMFDSILSKLDTEPEQAIEDIQKLKEFIESSNVAEDFKKQISDIFNLNGLLKIAEKLQKTVEEVRNQAKSPAIELAKIISFDLTGQENSVLDLIEAQKGILSNKTRASEFILAPDIQRDLEVAVKVMPIVQSVLWAAANGINEQANKMLATEGKDELLPTINNDLWYIYKQDLSFFQNQMDFMIKLTNSNLNAKTREQIIVRSNFYRHIVDLIKAEDADGESVDTLKQLQKAMGDFDLLEAVTRLGLLSLDFNDQSKDGQVKMQLAFANFEHEIYEHVKSKKLDYHQVGRDIVNVFNDSWKLKNGVLSIKFEDGLSNFDISNYFLSIIGYDSYELIRKLKSKFEDGKKFPYFGQELAIRLIAAEIEHPELFNGAIEGINDTLEYAEENGLIKVDVNQEDLKKDIEYLKDRTKLYNTIIIDGYAGVGKSTIVFNTATSLFNDTEVIGVSKIKARADALGLDSDHTYDINSLMSKILGEEYSEDKYLDKKGFHSYAWKDKNKKVNLSQLFSESSKKKILVIDECTLVKEGVWEAICTAAKEQNIHIVGLGNLMQSGETSNGTSANIDDCVGIFSTKLTVSMRDANVGKSLNNEYVGNVMNELVSAKKENPNFGEATIVQQNPTSPIVLKYFKDPDSGKLYGDHIISTIDDSAIEDMIKSLDENDTITIITPDGTFNALREKYKDDNRIVFDVAGNVAGSEPDYVVLNYNFDDNPKVKFTTLQSFYTLLSRAKKGTLMNNSSGLKTLLQVSDNSDPSAAVNTKYNADDAVAVEYKNNWLETAKSIPEPTEENSEEPNVDGGVESDDDIIPDGTDVNKHQLTTEEVVEQIEKEIDSEGPTVITENNESGDEQLGEGLHGEKLKAFKRRKNLLLEDIPIIDPEYYASWLYETSDFGDLSGMMETVNGNEEYIGDIRIFLQGLSSIFVNHKPDKWAELLEKRKTKLRLNIISDAGEDCRRVIDALKTALENKENVFFKKKFEDKMLLYYCFGGYALPVSMYKPDTTSSSIEGFCEFHCKQETPIIPITSRGQSRRGVKSILPKSIYVGSEQGDPITAIFTAKDPNYDDQIYRNKMFIKGVGKAFTLLLHEFGMTDEEILSIFNPEVDDSSGVITYFLKNNPDLYSIAGVQEDIEIGDFLNVLNIIQNFLNEGIPPTGKQQELAKITSFFGKTEDEVRMDFQSITTLDTGANIAENAARFAKVRKEYGLLYGREINSLITALFAYFQDKNSSYSQFTQNILTYFIRFYTNRTNGADFRRQGFRFSIRDAQKNDYNWYIIPTFNLNQFDVYYCGNETSGDASKIYKTTFDYADIIKTDGEFKFSIFNIIQQLFNNETIKNEIKSVRSDFNGADDEIKKLLKIGDIGFSLATGIQEESSDKIQFYPPFESNILKLIEGTDITAQDLERFIKNSTIFKYGIYRQIKKNNNPLYKDLWARGNVDFNNLSWDIVGILTPLFSVNVQMITNESELRKKYGSLYTPTNSNDVSINVNGRNITFVDSQGNPVNGLNDNIRDFLEKNERVLDTREQLVKVSISNDNEIVFYFTSGSYTRQIPIKVDDVDQTLQDLFKEYKNSNIKYSDLHNRVVDYNISIDGEEYKIERVDDKYHELQKDGITFPLKYRGASKTRDGKIYAYIESEKAFGNTTPKRVEITSNFPLYRDNNLNLFGYIEFDLTGNKILYFIDNSGKITRKEGRLEYVCDVVNKTFDEAGNLESIELEWTDDKNLSHNEIISANNIFEEQKSLFTPYFDGKFKINKKANVWRFIGNCLASLEFLRKITSNYNELHGGIISTINFKDKKITIDGREYDLREEKNNIELYFSNSEEFVNFEKEFKKLLSKFEKNLVNLQNVIKNLNQADDPVAVINDYLKNEIDTLKSSIRIEIDDKGQFVLVNYRDVEDLIINKILNTNKDLQFSKFNVTIDGNDAKILYDGKRYMKAKLENLSGEWKIDLFADDGTEISKQDFLNRLEEIKNLDPSLQDYVNMIQAKVDGVKLSMSQLKLSVELIGKAKSINGKPKTLLEELAILNEQPKYCKI